MKRNAEVHVCVLIFIVSAENFIDTYIFSLLSYNYFRMCWEAVLKLMLTIRQNYRGTYRLGADLIDNAGSTSDSQADKGN